jgi:Calcineurin-like phosphoesterase
LSFDIIGDIHGQADKLISLLRLLGYAPVDGAWRHPSRQAIFVGDYIDRGPRQIETIFLVRAMVRAGSALAILGNHELNAIAWYLPDPQFPGEHLRLRSGESGLKHRRQHSAFLTEVEHLPALHDECIQWFLSLPLWIDLPQLRVVHACWHPRHLAQIEPLLDAGRRLDARLIEAASRKGSWQHEALETLTKGLEIDLPANESFYDKDGHLRQTVRVRWWDAAAQTFRAAALGPDEALGAMPDAPVPETVRLGYIDTKPVFFGHYWLTGAPQPQGPTVACVDYSAGLTGPLVAYRWDGELALVASHFVGSF